ncbi:MAG: SWIM zinc finger domain-containing protein [Candidatus Pristimantibacillus sp.]
MTSLDRKLQQALENSLGDNLDDVIIQRGWDYYRGGHVMNVKLADEDTLYGAVQGSDIYVVVLDAGQFRYSTCTCPYSGYCKHMAAVYFAYCNEGDNTGFVAKAAYRRILKLDPRDGLTTASAVLTTTNQAKGMPELQSSPEQWQNWMDAEYGQSWRSCRNSLHSLQPILSSLKGTSRDWDKPHQRLHWMNVILFILEQAEYAIKSVDSFSRYYHEMSFLRMAEPWVEHYYTLVLELQPLDMDDQERQWAQHIVRFAYNRAIKTEQQIFDWSYIYMALCEKMSEDEQWHKRELAAMLASVDHEVSEEVNISFVHTATAMLQFFKGDDEEALKYFGKADFQRSQKVIYPCAAQRLEEGRWELFGLWMSFLYKHIYPNRNGKSIGAFVTLCRRADEDQPEEPRWTSYMTELLPHSYMELSDHWLAVKKYEEWADLQMLIGVKPEDLGVQDIREVSKVSPYAMIPIYHQSIDDWISSRNRQGYRMAVKYLKKLERLYKADNNPEKWDLYIAGIVRKYQRLRAFQEELWKGKVVT